MNFPDNDQFLQRVAPEAVVQLDPASKEFQLVEGIVTDNEQKVSELLAMIQAVKTEDFPEHIQLL